MSGSYGKQFAAEVARLEQIRDETAVEQIDRIIALAERHDDTIAAAEWMVNKIQTASYHDRIDKEIEAYHQLMALYRSGRGSSQVRGSLLWFYKWILERLPDYLSASRASIDAMFKAAEQFYRDEKESMAPLHSLRYRMAALMGHHEDALRWREEWENCPAGESDDCPACQTDTRVGALLDLGEPIAAIEAAEPVLSGEQSCEDVPTVTASRLLVPVLLHGNAEFAAVLHRAVRRHARYPAKFLNFLAEHVIFLTLVNGKQTAYRHGVVMLKKLAISRNDFRQFSAHRAGWIWLARRRAAGLPMRFPARVMAALPADAQDPERLPEWCESHARKLAAAFDRRNGTNRFTEMIGQAEQIVAM